MPVFQNIAGTTADTFKLGKGGPTIHKGASTPTGIDGDFWLDSTGQLKIKLSGSWENIHFDNLQLIGNTISSRDTNGSVSIVPDGTGNVVLGSAGGGTSTMTAPDDQSVVIQAGPGTASNNGGDLTLRGGAPEGAGAYGNVILGTASGGTSTMTAPDDTDVILQAGPATTGNPGGDFYIRGGDGTGGTGNGSVIFDVGDIVMSNLPSQPTEITALTITGTTIGYRDLGANAFTSTAYGDMFLDVAQTVTATKTFNAGTLLLDDTDTDFNLVLASTSTITTANKTLTFDVNDANRTLTIAANATISNTNTGDQTSIVGITGTKSQFDTAVTDGNFLYVGDVTSNVTTDLSLGTITATNVPINSSDGTDITTLPAATGSLAGILTAGTQTIGGAKTFSSTITGSISGNAGTVTNGVYTTRTISTTSPLEGGGDLSANRTIAIPPATTSASGYLTSTDWNTFNNKGTSNLALGITSTTAYRGDFGNAAYTGRIATFTTTGSSGAATFSANTLNIPTYTLSGLGGPVRLYKTGTYTAVSGNVIFADSAITTFTITLPATPSAEDFVTIIDCGDNAATNNITVARNSSTINGLTEDFIIDVDSGGIDLIYSGSTWEIGVRSSGVVAFEGAVLLSTGETGGNKYLREDGDGTCSWQTVPSGTTDLSLGTITATNVPINSSSGADITTLPAATGSLAGILTAGTQTIGGTKTFSSTITGSISGNAGTVTNGVYTTRTISTTSPLTGGGDLSANRTIAIPAATTSASGYLTSTDWNTFNNKVSNVTTNLSVGTVTATNVPILSSDGTDITTLPAATGSLAGILTAGTQTIGGTKTFNSTATFDTSTAGGPGSGIKIGEFELFPFLSGANAAQPTFRAVTTNANTTFRVIPNGTGLAQFEFFNTDYFTDSVNWENFKIVTGSTISIQTAAAGTGTVRPLELKTGANTNQLLLNTNGRVGIGEPNPAGRFQVSTPVQYSVIDQTILLGGYRTWADPGDTGVAITGFAKNGTLGSHDYGSIVMREPDNGSNGGGGVVQIYAGGESSAQTASHEMLRLEYGAPATNVIFPNGNVIANGNVYSGNTTLTTQNTFYMGNAGAAIPVLNFDANDYISYNRGGNNFNFIVGAVQRMAIGSGYATIESPWYIHEQASASSDIAAYGQIWVKNTTPNELWFTNDAGTDVQLGVGGDVTKYIGQNLRTASYTLVLSDAGKMIDMNLSSTPLNLTVPPVASENFPIDTRIDVCQYGTAQVTIVAGAGVTLRGNLKSAGQYAALSLWHRSSNVWVVIGGVP